MNLSRIAPASGALLSLAVVVTACASGAGGNGSPTAPADPSPVVTPTASPSPAPSSPGVVPSPTPGPTVAPDPSVAPPTVARHPVSSYARATADGVNVRLLPGLDQPLIDQEVFETREILRGVRLDAGDPVVVVMGPVVVDDIGWYLVHDNDGDRISWLTSGWVAGQYLEVEGPMADAPVTVAFDAYGADVSASGDVVGGYGLVYNIMAAPIGGAAACDVRVSLVVDGQTVEGVAVTVSEPTMLWQSQLENADLFAETAGTASIDVNTDCSVAGFLREVTQG